MACINSFFEPVLGSLSAAGATQRIALQVPLQCSSGGTTMERLCAEKA